MVEWLWHLITISPEFKHEGVGGDIFTRNSTRCLISHNQHEINCNNRQISLIENYRELSIKILALYLLGPVSSDEDVLVDEAESWLVDGAVIFIQGVVTADHRQAVLGSRLVGRETHLIKLGVRNVLQLGTKNDLDLWLCRISVIFPLLLILFDYAQRRFVGRCL